MRNLLDRLQPRIPVWNAGMFAGLAGAELAAAVSESGGIGVLGLGALTPAGIQRRIERTRVLTSRPFGANIMLPLSDGNDIAACMDARVTVLVLYLGDPQPYVYDAHRRDMFVVVQCGDMEQATAAADAGADAVIIQGIEAGGHVSARATLADAVPAAVRALGPRIPVIAAGGIATGGDVAKALTSGAQAVSLGTRFLATAEATAADAYKERLVAAGAAQTLVLSLFDAGGPDTPHRVISNAACRAWEQAGKPASGQREREREIIGTVIIDDETLELPRYTFMPPTRDFDGDIDAAPLYAGASLDQIHDIAPAATVMTRLAEELRAALR